MTSRESELLDQAAVVRAMAVKSPCDYMWLFGAGSSVTSGIKSATQCVWAWKRQLFLSEHPSVSPDLFADTTDGSVQDRIQDWIESLPSSPALGDPAEYGFFVEQCYPRAEDRRRSLEAIVQEGRPGPGYSLLGRMVAAGHFRWLWTTNFDDMLQRSIPSDCPRAIRQYGMDTTERLRSTVERDDYINLVHLHGDYRYDSLRNTNQELRSLDATFAQQLARHCAELPLLVVGYSGSDDSVMNALEMAYSTKGQGALFWLVLNDWRPNDRVDALVGRARRNGHGGGLVRIDGFDDFVRRAAQLLLPEEEVARLVENEREAARTARPSIEHREYPGRAGVAKSNTWPVTLPANYWACPVPHIRSWRELREQQGEAPVAAGLLGGRMVALGPLAEVARIARSDRSGVETVPFAQDDLQSDSVLHGVLRDYIVRALAGKDWQVGRRRGRWLIYDRRDSRPLTGVRGVYVCKAAEVDLHFRDGAPVLTMVPDRHVFGDDPAACVPRAAWTTVNQDLSRQWNRRFNMEFNEWRSNLGLRGDAISVGLGEGTTSTVVIGRGPEFIELTSPEAKERARLPIPRKFVTLRAFTLPEPRLAFGNGDDTHPIRGLLEKGPAELRLPRLTDQSLRLGIVVPEGVQSGVEEVLRELVNGHQQVETRGDYQLPYPGFERAFRTPLRLGTVAGGRIEFPVRLSGGNLVARQREALSRAQECVDRAAAASASVVLFVFPDAWEEISEVEDERRRLDFHDLLKAHAAPQGVRTQVLREGTPSKRQRLEILWWLALAVYAKSNRLPWTLVSPRSKSVHVGIGYGLDLVDRSRPVVVCCSHIYQSTGLGLRFQLSEVGEPAFVGRRRNPFLSQEDAYRVGSKALQSVVEASEGLPQRVAISKRTGFTKDERTGFLAALKQVPEVELLTVEVDDGVRLIRAEPNASDAALFPVSRGTVVPYGSHEALVWAHGDVAGVSSKYDGAHYYQGKSRIPAPLRITRYAGTASLEELAADLLGLSKMDWNTFDLYGKIPVQLSSPARIAKVAKLLDNTPLEDRDYRLFM